MKPALSPATLADLRRPRPYPAVSILLPTHRREPDNAQDALVLRNLVAEARERIEADEAVSREARMDVLEHLDQAVKEVDLVHAAEGLALFAAPGEHQTWQLSRSVPARVVLSETFLTRNLVAAQAVDQPYWVLAVAADHVSLWSGDKEEVAEHTDGGFPLTRTLADPDAQRKERIGDVPSVYSDEQTRKFLRTADAAGLAVLRAAPRPLFLIGEAEALAALSEVGELAGAADAHVPHGGVARGPASAVHEAVRPALADEDERARTAALQELDDARGRERFAAGVDEVWDHVAADRAGHVVLEEHYRVTARDDGSHLIPAKPGEPDAMEDIVDEIVERTLESGGKVSFVPDGALVDNGRIAAVLRY